MAYEPKIPEFLEGPRRSPESEATRMKYIVIRFGCGHVITRLRPAGVSDPMWCFCASCHPDPEATVDYPCSDCEKESVQNTPNHAYNGYT